MHLGFWFQGLGIPVTFSVDSLSKGKQDLVP